MKKKEIIMLQLLATSSFELVVLDI
jgi:hypothetical protein